MLKVNFYDRVPDDLLKFVVIVSRHKGKWVFCKHKLRNTYEFPGGHREDGETPLAAAKRELYEETGAKEYFLRPVCVYSVISENAENESFGMLFYAEIIRLESSLHYEIEKIIFTDVLPAQWTYPLIQPRLLEYIREKFNGEPSMLLFTVDKKDYPADASVFNRTAVRGLITQGEKYAMIHSKFGEYKFPGGGMNQGETYEHTLIREVAEETGLVVIPESIQYLGYVEEIRDGMECDVLKMTSHYYHCQVEDRLVPRNLDTYEADYEYRLEWVTLGEAIQNNENIKDTTRIPWTERDTRMMQYLITATPILL